jgi:hypothetical protein
MARCRAVRARAGSGVEHISLRHDGSRKIPNSSSAVAPGLDVRGDGGYVLVEPSETAGPHRYLASAPRRRHPTLADARDWLLESVREEPRRPNPPPKTRGPVVDELASHPAVELEVKLRDPTEARILALDGSAEGDSGRAARLYGAGEAFRASVGAAFLPFYPEDYERSTPRITSAGRPLGVAPAASQSHVPRDRGRGR